MARDEVEAAKLAVDLRDELADLLLQLRRVGEGWRGDLDHDDLADPLRVGEQEVAEGAQLDNPSAYIQWKGPMNVPSAVHL